MGFKELEKYAHRDKLDEKDFREVLVAKYRIKKEYADILAQTLCKNGSVSIVELKELAGSSSPHEQPSLSPRVFASSFKEANISTSQQISGQKRVKLNGALIR